MQEAVLLTQDWWGCPFEGSKLSPGVMRNRQRFADGEIAHTKASDGQFLNGQTVQRSRLDRHPPDCQPSNGERADGKCAKRNSSHRGCAHCQAAQRETSPIRKLVHLCTPEQSVTHRTGRAAP